MVTQLEVPAREGIDQVNAVVVHPPSFIDEQGKCFHLMLQLEDDAIQALEELRLDSARRFGAAAFKPLQVVH